MRAEEIRATFLSFFEDRGHRVVPSSSLVPSDPTMLLTTAGMVQFKPYFLGEQPAPYPRAASVQKCFRATDIDEVGSTARHHTFFEMLGNFSFGEYFKRDACVYAWDLLTGAFGIDPARIWVSVYEEDDEAAGIWRDVVGVPEERIVRFGREENFWHMGVAGPCGPCSEVFVDRGERFGPAGSRGPLDGPEDRYPEVWNLVFMQYVQSEPYEIVGELEQKGVDTGMGLERLAAVLQDAPSNFDTDLFTPLIARAREITGVHGAEDPEEIRLLRILSDHARAATFLIGDGVMPTNEGRGYVLRRVLRRAVTAARLHGVTERLLPALCEVVVDGWGGAYPELPRNREGILQVVSREEHQFSQTLDRGLGLLEGELESATGRLPGEVAFRLYDTYGFPLEITRDVAAASGLEVDVEGFELHMAEQRSRSRQATGDGAGAADRVRLDLPETSFHGYTSLEADGEAAGIVAGTEPRQVAEEGAEVDVVFDPTPFYPEGGGQIGDRGWFTSSDARGEVLDTQRHGTLILSRVRITAGALRVGDAAHLVVDPRHRAGAEQAHTTTHIVHHTLREMVGEHVRQMGSLVEPGRLRFDFTHFQAVDPDLLAEIEETANDRVEGDDRVRAFEAGYREATEDLGAIAFFDEKYGDVVRVVEVGDYSRELCGGTHVVHTGQIGFVKLVSEGSIGSNLRRVEALTGVAGLRYVNERLREAERAAELVKARPDELAQGVERLLRTQKELQRTLNEQQQRSIERTVTELLPTAREAARGKVLVADRPEDVDTLRKLAVALRDRLTSGVVILGTRGDGHANLIGAVSKHLLSEGIDARALLRAAASRIGGGAGGKPELAMAGGRKPEGLDEALATARAEAEGALGS